MLITEHKHLQTIVLNLQNYVQWLAYNCICGLSRSPIIKWRLKYYVDCQKHVDTNQPIWKNNSICRLPIGTNSIGHKSACSTDQWLTDVVVYAVIGYEILLHVCLIRICFYKYVDTYDGVAFEYSSNIMVMVIHERYVGCRNRQLVRVVNNRINWCHIAFFILFN